MRAAWIFQLIVDQRNSSEDGRPDSCDGGGQPARLRRPITLPRENNKTRPLVKGRRRCPPTRGASRAAYIDPTHRATGEGRIEEGKAILTEKQPHSGECGEEAADSLRLRANAH